MSQTLEEVDQHLQIGYMHEFLIITVSGSSREHQRTVENYSEKQRQRETNRDKKETRGDKQRQEGDKRETLDSVLARANDRACGYIYELGLVPNPE